jgi:hypothetical protein
MAWEGGMMTPEELEQMRADMAAGTPGPWHTGELARNAVFNWWLPADHPNACICECTSEVDARRIAGLPGLEAEVLRLTEERAALAEELARMRKSLLRIGDKAFINAGEFARYVREEVETALSHTGMTGPKEIA